MRRLSIIFVFVALGAALVPALEPTPALARRHTPAPTPSPTAVPTPQPTPSPTLAPAVRDARLHETLAAIARTAPGLLGVTVVDLARGERVSVRGDDLFPLASVGKLAVALAVFERSDRRRLDLDERVLITAADLRHGPGPLARDHPRGNVTLAYWQLVRCLLVEGDNTANDLLLSALGGPSAVQTTLQELGLRGFRIRLSAAERYAAERAHRTFAQGGDNAGTPNGVADLLTGIVEQDDLSLESTTEFLLDLSRAPTLPSRIAAGLPAGTLLAHTIGTSATFNGTTDATNDAGIVTLADGRRILIVAFLHSSKATADVRDATLAHVARAAYDAFVP